MSTKKKPTTVADLREQIQILRDQVTTEQALKVKLLEENGALQMELGQLRMQLAQLGNRDLQPALREMQARQQSAEEEETPLG